DGAVFVRDDLRALFRPRHRGRRQESAGKIGCALSRQHQRHRAQGRRVMARPSRIEGFAIVSDDGMLAGADRVMPDTLKFDADQRYFAEGLDRCEAVIHGRHSHEQQPHSPRRHRITVTNRVAAIAPDPENAKGILWNPSGAPLEKAWDVLGIGAASLGVVGATFVFGMFLDSY